MEYDANIVPSLKYPPINQIKIQCEFQKRVKVLLKDGSWLDSKKIDQIQFYGNMIREALFSGETPFIFIPLRRALTGLGVEAITESMGSLLKLQYQVNMNIETLLQEKQMVYHAPDFDHVQPFLD